MRIPAQSSGELVAELLRIISDLEYFLAQGHGCHSLPLNVLSVLLSVCTQCVCVERTVWQHCSLSHYVTMLPCCDSLSLLCGRVTLGLHNTGETVATACHWLPLRPTANWLARTRRVIVVALANGRAPSSDVVEFRVSQLVSRASRANNEPSLLVLRRPALRLVLARPTENH